MSSTSHNTEPITFPTDEQYLPSVVVVNLGAYVDNLNRPNITPIHSLNILVLNL